MTTRRVALLLLATLTGCGRPSCWESVESREGVVTLVCARGGDVRVERSGADVVATCACRPGAVPVLR